MAIIKVSEEKTGPNTLINVDVGLNDELAFPPVCPCCVEPAEQGAALVAECKELPEVVFPACAVCARHIAIEDRISSVLGPAMFFVSVGTVFGVLFYRGARATGGAGAGAGWQVAGGLLNMQFPFMGPVNAALSIAGGVAVLLVLLFIYWAVMGVLLKCYSKGACSWIRRAAGLSRWFYSEGGYCRRLTFDNRAYSAKFVESNSRETR